MKLQSIKYYYQILLLKNLSKGFLPAMKLNSYPASFVINTDKRTEPGEHWIAVYIDINKKDSTFFDSYGFSPGFYKIKAFLTKISNKLIYNQKRIQGFSDYCGLYCILFILFATRNKLHSFFNNFSTDFIKNDQLIASFFK